MFGKIRPVMNMDGKRVKASCACIGFSLFLRMAAYFGILNLADAGALDIFFRLALPVLLCIGLIVLMCCMKLHAPGLYGILGCAGCVLLLVMELFRGDLLQILVFSVLYLCAGGVLFVVCAGLLRSSMLAGALFLLLLTLRLVLVSLHTRGLSGLCMEGSVLLLIAGFMMLAFSLDFHKKEEQTAQ